MQFKQVTIIRHTANFDDMLAFYRDQLGLHVIEAWDEPNNRGAVLALAGADDAARVEVLDLNDLAVPDTPPANLNINLYVDDAVAWHDELATRGVAIARGLEDAPWGMRSFGIDDPDGLRIWLQQRLD